jgi:hypothetical protein
MTRKPFPTGVDPDRLALGIQQPWAELILRGVKTLEVRSTNTQVRGRIYLYTSQRLSALPASQTAIARHGLDLAALPAGRLVGSVELVESRRAEPPDAAAACLTPDLLTDRYVWRFAAPERLPEPLSVRFLPYGVWFYPFRRKNGGL